MSVLYQYSHFLAVSKGFYEGSLSIGELKKHGNTGLGTFNALDGELIAIDNQFYHCSNGHARIAKDNEMLPWAAVTNLTDNHVITVKNISSLEELQAVLLENLSSKNYPIALPMFLITAWVESTGKLVMIAGAIKQSSLSIYNKSA